MRPTSPATFTAGKTIPGESFVTLAAKPQPSPRRHRRAIRVGITITTPINPPPELHNLKIQRNRRDLAGTAAVPIQTHHDRRKQNAAIPSSPNSSVIQKLGCVVVEPTRITTRTETTRDSQLGIATLRAHTGPHQSAGDHTLIDGRRGAVIQQKAVPPRGREIRAEELGKIPNLTVAIRRKVYQNSIGRHVADVEIPNPKTAGSIGAGQLDPTPVGESERVLDPILAAELFAPG
ncbi:hypothetical protein OROGR_023608 [Orobanche gracilis]